MGELHARPELDPAPLILEDEVILVKHYDIPGLEALSLLPSNGDLMEGEGEHGFRVRSVGLSRRYGDDPLSEGDRWKLFRVEYRKRVFSETYRP